MKLRHQILILLGLPVACQIVSVCVLGYSVSKLDEAATREITAKKVMSATQETVGLLGQRVIDLTSRAFSARKYADNENDQILKSLAEMKELVKDEPESKKIVDRFGANMQRFLVAWEDILKSYHPGKMKMYLAQFFENQESLESMDLVYRLMKEDATRLKEIYGPIAEEFQPRAIATRMALRNAVVGAIVFDVLLVVVLAVLVNKNTLTRLQLLMNNIRAFSQPKAQLQELSGNDELAELDKAFRQMAAERSQLDEIRKSLMAMASHDLRTPLTSMNIALEFILTTQAASLLPEVLRKLQYMSSEANRLVRLSSTFLDIEKIESGKLEVEMKKFSLTDIVEPSIAAVRSLADARSIEIVDTSNKTWKLSCDQERTIQVLVNLLSNAIKFSPKDGSVTVRSVPAENDLLRVEVTDNGSGVRESESKLLFNKFSQLDQKAEIKKSGSGLGLYICKMLITAQGGEIGYYPIKAGGSCFWFELPALSKLT